MIRFVEKGKKWYGWTQEEAEHQWDDAFRDPTVNKITDEFGALCVAKLHTWKDTKGTRLGNKRAIGEQKHFNAGDEGAIEDAAQSVDLNYVLNSFVLSFGW